MVLRVVFQRKDRNQVVLHSTMILNNGNLELNVSLSS